MLTLKIGKYRLAPVNSAWDALNNTASFKIDGGGFACPECGNNTFHLHKTAGSDVKCCACGEPITLQEKEEKP